MTGAVYIPPLSARMACALAHLLAWIAFLFLLLYGSFYQVTTAVPEVAASGAMQQVQEGESLADVNGRWVIWLIVIPVVTSGAALTALLVPGGRRRTRLAVIWTAAVLTLAFCVVGLASIGMFYLPSAIALLAAALLAMRGQTVRVV